MTETDDVAKRALSNNVELGALKVGESSSTNGPWKFSLNSDLHNGAMSLIPDEHPLDNWKYVSTSMSLAEWIATVATLGLYYFITRKLLQRKRMYSIHVTNLNIIVKEEMTENWLGCVRLLLENQATFPIRSLAFVTAEELGPRVFGWFPSSVVLDMRFNRYPLDSEYPKTAYRSLLAICFEPFIIATKSAFKQVFGIDFDAEPVVLVTQVIRAAPLFASLPHWMAFGGAFGLSLIKQMYQAIFQMLKSALLDPSVGPRQAIGQSDACEFRLEVDASEDGNCHERMRKILKLIVGQIEDRNIVNSTTRTKLLSPLVVVGEGEKARDINSNKPYGSVDEYVVLADYLHIMPDEVVYDVCPANPKWTWSNIKKVIGSFGAYYITDLAGHIKHRQNMIHTNKRVIQHSVLVADTGKGLEHSRLDFWVADKFTNIVALDMKKKCTFSVTAAKFGWASFEMDVPSDFVIPVFRSFFIPRFQSVKTPGLTVIPQEIWRQNPENLSSVMTQQSITQSETIEVSIYSEQRLYTCMAQAMVSMCCAEVPKATVTCTDECLYVEHYTTRSCLSSIWPTSRSFVILPWCDVDGIFWQNFHASGPGCCNSFLLSCFCSPIFGCGGCMCCCNPNGAPQNNPTYHDHVFGNKGNVVALCVRGNSIFGLGLRVPHSFYGIPKTALAKNVNALVDTITYRSTLNSEFRKPIGEHVTLSTGVIAEKGVMSGALDSVSQMGQSINGSGGAYIPTAQVVTSPPLPTQPAACDQYQSAFQRGWGGDQGFPMSGSDQRTTIALAPGERLLKPAPWRVETTMMQPWEIVYAILTFGIGYFIRKILNVVRHYNSITVTSERIIFQEELFVLQLFTILRTYENQSSFKICDISYINVQEIGPRYCGIIPPTTEISLRFGKYPKASDTPSSLDPWFSPSSSDKTFFAKAAAIAKAIVTGINDEAKAETMLEECINYELTIKTFFTEIMDKIRYYIAFSRALVKQIISFILHLLYKLFLHFFMNNFHAAGANAAKGYSDARAFTIRFRTANSPQIANEILQVLTELSSQAQASLNVPASQILPPLAADKYSSCAPNLLTRVNDSNNYGDNNGFIIQSRIWTLVVGETVYDVTPDNPSLTCKDWIVGIACGPPGWYFLYLQLQHRRSWMLTDKRLISHKLTTACGSLTYSSLEMWFHTPVSNFTIVETQKSPSCCHSKEFNFSANTLRFGNMIFHVDSEQFMKNFLKLTMKRASFQSDGLHSMSLDQFAATPVLGKAELTKEFLLSNEIIDGGLGAELPLRFVQQIMCRSTMKFTLVLTNQAIFIEAFSGHKRIFSSIPWDSVNGVYWSNFQGHSDLLGCYNRPAKIYNMHGYSGCQVRINVKGSNSFAPGIILPQRFYGCDDAAVNFMVQDLAMRMNQVKGESSYYKPIAVGKQDV